MKSQLCIGTAQFGMNYGITNDTGQVKSSSVANLLSLAEQNGISFIDTARAYGNAEYVVGCNLPSRHHFHLISKLESQQIKYYTNENIKAWEDSFQETCRNLKTKRLGSFLLHSTNDLRKRGSKYLIDWLLGLKERGLVERLGVSIYNSGDLLNVNPKLLDLVQLPLSLFDQRLLLDGTIDFLHSNNTAIHARSLYLQGLLLTPSTEWPNWIPVDIINHQLRLEELSKEKNCELIDLALGFAREQESLEAVVLGICDIQQFNQLLKSWSSPSPWKKREWSKWYLNNPRLLDPRQWPRKTLS